ncbi:MAG: 4-hydroxy-3-methylbut-2-enyl diphosphate reductase [Patescibacteria group bacterium]
MRILLTKPRGFCAGVDRAVDIVEMVLRAYGAPIYVKHEIVHNEHVVEGFKKRGVKFIEDPAQVPAGSVLILSAHGVSPEVRAKAEQNNLKVIDATCPLVNKVHIEAKSYSKRGYSIILIGHRGHAELEGTAGEAPSATQIIESTKEVASLKVADPNKVIYLTQTTLSVDETADIIKALKNKLPKIIEPAKEDICYATTNRQAAVKELAKQCDIILVVGSKQSSNSNRLREVAEASHRTVAGGAKAYLVSSVDDLNKNWFVGVDTVGMTSGASTPEKVVQSVIEWLQQNGGEEPTELKVIDENVYFTLPPELKKLGVDPDIMKDIADKHRIKKEAKLYTNNKL